MSAMDDALANVEVERRIFRVITSTMRLLEAVMGTAAACVALGIGAGMLGLFRTIGATTALVLPGVFLFACALLCRFLIGIYQLPYRARALLKAERTYCHELERRVA